MYKDSFELEDDLNKAQEDMYQAFLKFKAAYEAYTTNPFQWEMNEYYVKPIAHVFRHKTMTEDEIVAADKKAGEIEKQMTNN